MKKILRIFFYLVVAIVIIVFGLLSYVKIALPSVGDAPELKISASETEIERGRYLANHVTVCIDCHSARDWSRFSGPPIGGTYGKGGDRFDQQFGFPGVFYAKNITPAGIKEYSDGELFRVITTGVNRKGEAMFPIMPYHYYGQMDEEDIKAIIAYIRTLPAIENNVPESVPDFPMNFIINTIPHKPAFQKKPDSSDKVKYGAYLANAAACIECHTPAEKGQIIQDKAFVGGRDFNLPIGTIYSSNITPDEETGIGTWTSERFVKTFKSKLDSSVMHTQLAPGAFNSVMPWTMYAGMTEQDLDAIFAFLKTLKPVKNEVLKFKPKEI